MATYSDSFTDTEGTNVIDHTPDSTDAFTWSVHPGETDAGLVVVDDALIESNTVAVALSTKRLLKTSVAPPGVSLSVGCIVVIEDLADFSTCEVWFLNSTTQVSGYALKLNQGSDTISLLRVENNSTSVIDTASTGAVSVGLHSIRLTYNLTTGVLIGYLDGVEMVTATDTTFASFVAYGLSLSEPEPV